MSNDLKNKKEIGSLLEEAGLNSVYRNHLKRMDYGLLGGNKQGEIISRENYSTAEKCFRNPQVSTCFLIIAFALMKKKLVCKETQEGKKREIAKSKKIANFINFSLKKLQNGGVRQLQFDMVTAKFFGFSLLEKVYDIMNPAVSSKYGQYYYYKSLKAKRPGLWDFVYDSNDNVIGYRSLLKRDKVWSKRKFIHLAYLPLFNNSNGNGDFERVWKFWDAKDEFIIFLLDLGSRLAKGKSAVLKSSSSYNYDKEEVDTVLEELTENLAVYLPPGLEVDWSNFDFGALQYFLAVLRWLDSQIAIAMLGSSLAVNESSQGTGTYAQSQTHMENSMSFMDYMEGLICDAMDEQYMRDLILLNFDTNEYPEEIWPHFELVFEKEESLTELSSIYEKLKSMNVIDTDTETDIRFLREKFKLPDNEDLFEKVETIINNSLNKNPNETNLENEDEETSIDEIEKDNETISNMAEFYK